MSASDKPRSLPSAGEDQVQEWLSEAESASKSEDWDRAVALYRKALEFDRALQGVEAKLQWAIRMRDTENLYRQGKEKIDAGKFSEALVPLRKARLMYASHYKDVDELIVQAQSALQKEKWETRPSALRTAERKRQRQRQQRMLLGILAVAVILGLALAFAFTSGFGLMSPRSSASQLTSSGAAATGSAATIPPEQRDDMYKAPPPMTIDTNKSYTAVLDTTKGTITMNLYPQDAPQSVNNFVFLAREGFYNGLTFHRYEPGFVIQGGDPLGNGTGGPGYTIPPEIKRNHTKGAVAMARRGGPPESTPSSGSQFYITLAPQTFLDNNYTVFGQATDDSMAVVDQIRVGDVIKTITIQEK